MIWDGALIPPYGWNAETLPLDHLMVKTTTIITMVTTTQIKVQNLKITFVQLPWSITNLSPMASVTHSTDQGSALVNDLNVSSVICASTSDVESDIQPLLVPSLN